MIPKTSSRGAEDRPKEANRGAGLLQTAPLFYALTFQTLKKPATMASLRCDGLVAPWILDAPMNRRSFEVWIETQLLPTLSPGDVVILDNVAFHKSPTVVEVLRKQGVWLLFLPPYSPDLNPIEVAYSKLKALWRKQAWA